MVHQIKPTHVNEGKLRQISAAVIVNILAVSYGITLGWLSPLIPQLLSSETPVGDAPMSEESASWIGGLLCLGALCVSPFSGTLIERLGRKGFGYAACAPILLAWLVAIFATSQAHLFASMFLAGVGGAMSMFLAPIYASEIASEEVRGVLGSLLIFAINIGMLLAYVAGPFLSYRLFVLSSMAFPLIFFLAFFFVPETPVYLLRKKRQNEAVRSLMFFRGNNKILVDEELTALQSQVNDPSQAEEKVGFLELFKDRATFKGIIIAFGLLGGQQLSGVAPMATYTETIFRMAGSSLSAEYAAIIIGVVQIFGSYLATFLIERAGRRPLVLVSCAGMAVCLFIVGGFCYLQKFGQDISAIGWIPVTALSTYMVVSCLGMGPVPFIVAAEIFRVNVLSLANSLCMFFLWTMAFVVMTAFGSLLPIIGIENCFLLLGSFTLGSLFFCYFLMPETRGRKREDIVAELAGNDVGRNADSYNEKTCVKDNEGFDGKKSAVASGLA